MMMIDLMMIDLMMIDLPLGLSMDMGMKSTRGQPPQSW